MTEETKNTQEQEAETQPQESKEPSSPEIIEIEWEEAKEMVSIRAALLATEQQLSKLLLACEKQKSQLLSRTSDLESLLYQTASALKDSKDVDDSVAYELRLPESEGTKGYFVKKE